MEIEAVTQFFADNLIAQHELKAVNEFARECINHREMTDDGATVIAKVRAEFECRTKKRLAHKEGEPWIERNEDDDGRTKEKTWRRT
jgi:hypothetical protein